ncbi:MAG: hypothetical protein ACLU37_09370 [Collinsella sp.]
MQHALQLVKRVLVGICALCVMGIWPQVSGASPWVFAGITARSLEGIASTAFAALGAVMVGMALVERFFCQFSAPSAPYSRCCRCCRSRFQPPPRKLSRGCNRSRTAARCASTPSADLRSGECIACGRCADGCPMANVTLARLDGFQARSSNRQCQRTHEATPASARPQGRHRGMRVALTLVKAPSSPRSATCSCRARAPAAAPRQHRVVQAQAHP